MREALQRYVGQVANPAVYRPGNFHGALAQAFLPALGLVFYSPLASLETERDALLGEEKAILASIDAAGRATDEQRARLVAIDSRFTGSVDKPGLTAEIAAEERRRERQRSEPSAAASGTPEITFTKPTEAPKPFGDFGAYLSAVRDSAVLAKSGRAPDARLVAIQDYARTQAAASGLQESVGSDGGFAVQTDMIDRILDRIDGESVLWPLAQPVPLSDGSNGAKINVIDETTRATGSRFGGVQVYWEAEAAAATAKKPKIQKIELNLAKLFGIGYRTDEVGQDWRASGAVMERAFVSEMAFVLDDAAVRGTGAGVPLGFLNSPALVTVSKETGQAVDTVLAENIYKMFARMPARSKRRAAWYINGDLWPQIFQLAQVIGTGGVPLFIPSGALGDAPGGNILGRPVVEIEQASAPGDLGDISFVDMAEYVRLEKGGIQRATSIHVEFLTDQEVFRWILRTNGAPGWKSAITPYKGSATRSPFVILEAR